MTLTFTAVYENGVLRPLTPLPLREHAQVEIQLGQVAPPTTVEREAVIQALLSTGQVQHQTATWTVAAPDTEERQIPATLLGSLTSEIIIAQRGGAGL